VTPTRLSWRAAATAPASAPLRPLHPHSGKWGSSQSQPQNEYSSQNLISMELGLGIATVPFSTSNPLTLIEEDTMVYHHDRTRRVATVHALIGLVVELGGRIVDGYGHIRSEEIDVLTDVLRTKLEEALPALASSPAPGTVTRAPAPTGFISGDRGEATF